MNTYIVTFNLKSESPPECYNTLVSLIKEEGVWACLGSFSYLIQSELSAVELRDKFKPVINANGALYVGKVLAPAAWTGYSNQVTDWIKNKL